MDIATMPRLLSLFSLMIVIDQGAAVWLRYVDYSLGMRKQQDLFYDRLVSIRHNGEYQLNYKYNPWDYQHPQGRIKDHSFTAVGVIITKRLVLTTYNPFREIIRIGFKRRWTYVAAMRTRICKRYYDPHLLYYQGWNYNIDCARQVEPANDGDVPMKFWHGFPYQPKMHSPLHDLMIIKVERDIDYFEESPPTGKRYRYTLKDMPLFEDVVFGPIVTKVASPRDEIGRTFTFVSLAYEEWRQVKMNYLLRMEEYQHDDNVLTDCEEWIPREWGWFFCLRNVGNFLGMDSGAVLFSNEKLFGMGSFTLFKGNKSIFVFTDVRKYYHLLNVTCTDDDQNLVPPPPETVTEKREGIYWVATNSTEAASLEDSAVVGGKERWDGSPLWVIRAKQNNDLVPGKLAAKHEKAFIPYKGQEVQVQEFEVLCANPKNAVFWEKASDGFVPKRALAAGSTANGNTLYVCRVEHAGSLIPGKFEEGYCWLSSAGSETWYNSYEILCEKKKKK